MGHKLEVPDLPQRIISLVPSQTELLHYWGLEDRVVGITKFCVHPEEWYRSKTRIGGTKTVNFDKIKDLKPDLIIGNKEENTQEEIDELGQNYPVWMSDMQSLEDVWSMMTMLGELLGVAKVSNQLIEQLKGDFLHLEAVFLKQEKIKVAYFIWQSPHMVAAANTFIDTLLQKSGFKNVFGDLERYPEVSLEMLENTEIDAILLSSEPYPFKNKHIEWFQNTCPNSKVVLVDGELFSWYGSRLLLAVDYIKKLRKKLVS